MKKIQFIFLTAIAILSLSLSNANAQIKPDMVLVDGGTFLMGNPKTDPNRKDDKDEEPVHNVKVNGFYIGKFEVSVKEYKKFVDDSQGEKSGIMDVFKGQLLKFIDDDNQKINDKNEFSDKMSRNKINPILNDSVVMPPAPDEKFWEDHPDTKKYYPVVTSWWGFKDNYPMHCVTWYEAIAYCNWLSEKQGFEKCYSVNKDKGIDCDLNKNGYRLPTEAEWEFAARGGNKSQGFRYSGSNSVEEVAWIDETSGDAKPGEIGKKKANELGIYDMSGNVWEWCSDYYFKDYYTTCKKAGTVNNPFAATSNSYRVLRGGGWYYRTEYATLTSRDGPQPFYSNYAYGFRLARTNK